MDKELQEYYETQFDLFASAGYKALIEDAKKVYDQLNNVAIINSVEQLYVRKGELSNLLWIINREAAHNAAYTQLSEEVGNA